MRRIHFIVGLTFVLVFLATGVVMRIESRAAPAVEHAIRFMRRSDHVYILLGALLNLLLDTYLHPSAGRAWLQTAGSLCVLAAPVFFLLAFFAEPAPDRLFRPLTGLGAVLSLLGVFCHVFAAHRGGAA